LKVIYVTDVEGNWNYFCNFVDLSPGIRFRESGDHRQARYAPELVLKDGFHFVFGGDTCDKGPGSIRCLRAFVQLKRDYSDRVHLLLGNRDINKIRFTSELTDEEVAAISPKSPAAYWVPEKKRERPWQYMCKVAAKAKGVDVSDLSESDVRAHITTADVLRYHLKHDMGGDGEFEFRRQELAHLWNRNIISDDEVVKSFKDGVAPGGEMREYMKLAQLACVLDTTLFVHGQLIGNQFWDCSQDGIAWAVGAVPEPDYRSHRELSDLHEWVSELNEWASSEVAAWEAQPTWVRSPTDETTEG